jgi:hypothetical protein
MGSVNIVEARVFFVTLMALGQIVQLPVPYDSVPDHAAMPQNASKSELQEWALSRLSVSYFKKTLAAATAAFILSFRQSLGVGDVSDIMMEDLPQILQFGRQFVTKGFVATFVMVGLNASSLEPLSKPFPLNPFPSLIAIGTRITRIRDL